MTIKRIKGCGACKSNGIVYDKTVTPAIWRCWRCGLQVSRPKPPRQLTKYEAILQQLDKMKEQSIPLFEEKEL